MVKKQCSTVSKNFDIESIIRTALLSMFPYLIKEILFVFHSYLQSKDNLKVPI